MLQYERLVEEYSNSGKEYTDAEKQMTARAMGRYHSLLIKNGVEQSAAYLKELEAILPSYLEGLVDGLGENSEELGKTLEGIFNSEELPVFPIPKDQISAASRTLSAGHC